MTRTGGLWISLVFAGFACTAHSSESPTLAGPELEPSELHLTEAESESVLPACMPEGFRPQPPLLATTVAEPDSGPCWRPAQRVREQLFELSEAKWFKRHEQAWIELGFACDRLGETEDLTEVVWQSGSGHGGTLDLARLRRTDAGDWELLLLRRGAGRRSSEGERGAGVWRGRASATAVEEALKLARAAIDAELRELGGPKDEVSALSSSTGDFHGFVRLEDAGGHGRAIAFTGYPETEHNATWVPALIAEWSLRELIDDASLSPAPVDSDSQAFFMARFVETQARERDAPDGEGWWVRDRLVEMTGTHATLDLVPALAAELCPSDDDAPHVLGGTGTLAAIFTLIGHDEPVPVNEGGFVEVETARRWSRACAARCP